MKGLAPAGRLEGLQPYRPPRGGGTGVRLHANEGRAPPLALADALGGLDLAEYPSATLLEERLARVYGLESEQVVLTAGADDALARLALAYLEPGRRAALLDPTFEMIPRYVQVAGGQAVSVPWFDTPFPEEDFARALDTAHVGFLVSPSSPAGEVASLASLERLADFARSEGKLLIVDLAYVEFADRDPTAELLARGAVVTRTFSKALGLAGLRVGYVLAPSEVTSMLRAIGQPFSVSSLALAVVGALFDRREVLSRAAAARVREERERLYRLWEELGFRPIPSQGNFVLAQLGSHAQGFVEALAERGFRVRRFVGAPPLDGCVRISCPQDETVLEGLMTAMRSSARELGVHP